MPVSAALTLVFVGSIVMVGAWAHQCRVQRRLSALRARQQDHRDQVQEAVRRGRQDLLRLGHRGRPTTVQVGTDDHEVIVVTHTDASAPPVLIPLVTEEPLVRAAELALSPYASLASQYDQQPRVTDYGGGAPGELYRA